MAYDWRPLVEALSMREDHEHYFSSKIPEDEQDLIGRFDAVLRIDGAFVYNAEANEWFAVDSYEDAKALAKECAEAW